MVGISFAFLISGMMSIPVFDNSFYISVHRQIIILYTSNIVKMEQIYVKSLYVNLPNLNFQIKP